MYGNADKSGHSPINTKLGDLVKPRSCRVGDFLLCLRFIFIFILVLSVSRPKLPLGQLSSPDDVIISQL